MSASASDEEDGLHVVLDCGSSCMKAGFGGEDQPRVVFPSIVGRVGSEGWIAGDEVASKGHLCVERQPQHPVQNGVVTDWEYMEAVSVRVRCAD